MAGSYAPIISDSLCCPYDANSNKCNHTKQLTAVPDKKKDRTNGITTSQTMNQFSNARRSLTLIENANCCVKLKQYRAIQASDCILWACEREFYIRKGEINFCFVFSVLTVMQLAFFCVCRLLCTDCYVQIVMYRLLCTDCYVQIVMYRSEVLTVRGGVEGRESEGHDRETQTQTLGLQQTQLFSFFSRVSFLRLRVWKLEPVPLSFAERNLFLYTVS